MNKVSVSRSSQGGEGICQTLAEKHLSDYKQREYTNIQKRHLSNMQKKRPDSGATSQSGIRISSRSS